MFDAHETTPRYSLVFWRGMISLAQEVGDTAAVNRYMQQALIDGYAAIQLTTAQATAKPSARR